MTREEAIQILSDLQDGSGQTYEAIRMAIEALENKPTPCEINVDKAIEMAIEALSAYEKIVGNMSHEINMLKEQLESADAEQGCDGCRYNVQTPQVQCLRCKRYWRDIYERKGGDDE